MPQKTHFDTKHETNGRGEVYVLLNKLGVSVYASITCLHCTYALTTTLRTYTRTQTHKQPHTVCPHKYKRIHDY